MMQLQRSAPVAGGDVDSISLQQILRGCEVTIVCGEGVLHGCIWLVMQLLWLMSDSCIMPYLILMMLYCAMLCHAILCCCAVLATLVDATQVRLSVMLCRAVSCCVFRQGMWNELLGFGDFYYELGVQLLEACLASRWVFSSTGGGSKRSALVLSLQLLEACLASRLVFAIWGKH
jgi:hypothetical protein